MHGADGLGKEALAPDEFYASEETRKIRSSNHCSGTSRVHVVAFDRIYYHHVHGYLDLW